MICKNCGAALPDDALFCPNCGQQSEDNVPAKQQTPTPQLQPEAKKGPKDILILIFGILSIWFSFGWGVFAFRSLIGLGFGIAVLILAKKYVEAGNELAGKAKIGRILGIVGLILSIVIFVSAIIGLVIGIVILGLSALFGGLSESGSWISVAPGIISALI